MRYPQKVHRRIGCGMFRHFSSASYNLCYSEMLLDYAGCVHYNLALYGRLCLSMSELSTKSHLTTLSRQTAVNYQQSRYHTESSKSPLKQM